MIEFFSKSMFDFEYQIGDEIKVQTDEETKVYTIIDIDELVMCKLKSVWIVCSKDKAKAEKPMQ
jgi:hypothetical protein